MKKVLVRILKVLGGLVAAVVVTLGGGFLMLNTDTVQNRLLKEAVAVLEERLQTQVTADHVRVSVTPLELTLQGVTIEDREQRKMFEMEELSAHLELWPLLERNVIIKKAGVQGLTARLYKPSPDEPANYQFVIDAFKKEKKRESQAEAAPDSVKAHQNVSLAVEEVNLDRINVTYNDRRASLAKLGYIDRDGRRWAEIANLTSSWVHTKKNGTKVDNRVDVGTLYYVEQDGQRGIDIVGLRYVTDNHLPRKNKNKPKRGFFDQGHFDVVGSLKLQLTHVAKDSVAATLAECQLSDRGSGFDIKSLTLQAATNMKTLWLRNVDIRMKNTKVAFDSGVMQIPSKKDGRAFTYHTSTITGTTLLKDISRPFAPVLSRFSIPLQLRVKMSGSDDRIDFRDAVVSTTDKKLNVRATGRITNLRDKYKLHVHFDVHQMTAQGGSKERIISQFPVKKYMMKQLHSLGTIGYKGGFDVLWKKEQFYGRLTTRVGDADFRFTLDEKDKYVFGSVKTDSFQLGRAMDMPDLGRIACTANFRFDISKPRTAKMRKVKGGKLPIGHIDAVVSEGKYKFIKVHNLVAEINSDGAVAQGSVVEKGKRMDIGCTFSFTNTNEMQKTKIKPGIRFHKMTDSAKAVRAEKREIKRKEKEARKQKMAEEKEAKRLQKAMEKEQKAIEKEAQQKQKDAEKEAKRQQKAAEKEAKRQQKAAEKEAKRQRKAAEEEAKRQQKAAEKEGQ